MYSILATPNLDFISHLETLTFSSGQHRGDSVCADISILSDDFVESNETFNVLLVSSSPVAVIQSGKDRATVVIMDRRQPQSVLIQICIATAIIANVSVHV